MSEYGRERRSSDPLLVEVHGMMSKLTAHFEDHVKSDESNQARTDKRLEPVEEFFTFAKTAMKIGATIVALGGVGGVITWIKIAAAHVHVP